MSRAIAIANARKAKAASLAAEISAFLSERGISCRVFEHGQGDAASLFDFCDFAVTLGGDGTVLFAARHCAPRGIPIFPVNLGEFGFIAGIEPARWKDELASFLDGASRGAERMLLMARVFREGKELYSSPALNDCALSAGSSARIVDFKLSFSDGEGEYSLGHFKADGIIAATPTGSTAYSAAAGGPILSPDVPAIVLSPVCAFSLSSRPIVLPASGEILIDFCGSRGKGDGLLSVDGQESLALMPGDRISISMAERPVRLIGCPPSTFYNALRCKLAWSGAPVARVEGGGIKE